MIDELDFAFGVLPLCIIILSVAGTYLFKNAYVMPLASLAVCLICTFTVLNKTFIGWALLYTLVSFALSHITMVVVRKNKE
ncbi:DUF2651 family protein [Bacillus sp. ISL-51]|uniref:DUF2651 family protein n=1 Tax=Bacteria TaxID=2 RepID=UPI001BEA2F0F|nr:MULTISPECIES: DUF2651 family protein [Bacteria]MBT2574679.1 DUF2651 family protein [Bacillus sp. ISL-51]MBT2636244.1 DUF2651 family protein [Bacillus sp. ISL-26]MBT2711284.1 DUF2651 family protein [Pseudomonas sp. ISL-88]